MSILGQKIREIRQAAGLNQAQFADETGVSQGTVSKWEKGEQIPEGAPMIAIARIGNSDPVTLYDLAKGKRFKPPAAGITQPEPDASTRIPLTRQPQKGGRPDLAVRGIALGGAEGEGDFQLNGNALDYIARPAGLLNRPNAFAVILRNTSMEPVYKHGWPIFVDPDGRKPVEGEDVLLELFGEDPDDRENGPAFIKTLVRQRGGQIVLSQYNPVKELSFDASRKKNLYRVISYPEAMGLAV